MLLLAAADAVLIASWQPFYSLMGTGAAALLGLVFVAMSLRYSIDASRSIALERSIWSAGGISLVSFANALVVALAFMVPDQNTYNLGLATLLLGVLAGGITLVILILMVRGLNRVMRVSIVIALLCFGAQCVLSVALLRGQVDGLHWLALSLALMLIVALFISWILLASPLFVRMQKEQAGSNS